MEFKAMKFIVESPEHSRQIQERLFEMGYSWSNIKEIRQLERKYLYANSDNDITWGDNDCFFNSHFNKLTTLQDIQWQPKQGEMIEVSDNNINWVEREFVAKMDRFNMPYIVVSSSLETVNTYKHARPIQKIYFSDETIEEIKSHIDKMLRGKLLDQAIIGELKKKLL